MASRAKIRNDEKAAARPSHLCGCRDAAGPVLEEGPLPDDLG
jgi:hypothetical protein